MKVTEAVAIDHGLKKEEFAKNAVPVFFLNLLEMIQFLFQLECSIIQQN